MLYVCTHFPGWFVFSHHGCAIRNGHYCDADSFLTGFPAWRSSANYVLVSMYVHTYVFVHWQHWRMYLFALFFIKAGTHVHIPSILYIHVQYVGINICICIYLYVYLYLIMFERSRPPFWGWRRLPIPRLTRFARVKHVNGGGCGLSAKQDARTVLWGGCHSRLRGIQVIEWCSCPASSRILLWGCMFVCMYVCMYLC